VVYEEVSLGEETQIGEKMQLFLPHSTLITSAIKLDNNRLLTQCIETKHIAKAIFAPNETTTWKHEPIVLQWKGHSALLLRFGIELCREAEYRRLPNTALIYDLMSTFRDMDNWFSQLVINDIPWWLGNIDYHYSQRALLIRKDPGYYAHLWPYIDPNLPLLIPTKTPGVFK
jgi:hypothetical protein